MWVTLRMNIYVMIILVLIQYLNQICETSPIETEPNSELITSTPLDELDEDTTTLTDLSLSIPITNATNDDEILDTADSIVFRPLFVYRQQQAKRRRLSEKKVARRKDPPAPPKKSYRRVYHPYGYVYGYPYRYPYRYPSDYQLYSYSYYKPKQNISSKKFRRRNSEKRPIVWPYWG